MSIFNLIGGALGGLGSFFGSQQNAQAQEQINSQNIAEQEAFAKNGIQWKVADAKAAGINPLAALGASTSSFSNVVAPQPGAGLGAAGQSIGRAIASTQSEDDRAYSDATRSLDLQARQLQNDLLASQIRASDARLVNQPGNGPPTPTPAQTFAGGIPDTHMVVPGTTGQDSVRIEPDKVTQGAGNVTAGLHPEVSLSRAPGGEAGFYPYPSHDMSVAMFNPWSQTAWSYRNMLAPMWDDSVRPPGMTSDKGWRYDPIRGYVQTGPDYPPGTIGYWVDRHHWFY